MTEYYKIIGLSGDYFAKEFKKIKHHKNKIRMIKEETIAKSFKAGKASVRVIFEEKDEEILLDNFSDQEDIKKYLGKNFL